MSRQKWKAGNMIYPLPAALVGCGNQEKPNLITVGWTGTICTNPAMTYISLRKSRYSYALIKQAGYFSINLTTRALVKATDFCGVRSGRDCDKFQEMGLTPGFDEATGCVLLEESPVSIVCRVTEIKELGSHDMFLAEVVNVYVDEKYMDKQGKFHLNASDLIAYSHGSYFSLGEQLGTFGYSVMKTKTAKKQSQMKQDTSKHKKQQQHNKTTTTAERATKKQAVKSTKNKKKVSKGTKKK